VTAPAVSPAAVGVLLAGGRSSRMGGGDKTLRTLGGRPILDWIVERARPQVGRLIVNANGDPGRFQGHHLPVVADVAQGFLGPLAGVLTALEWAATHAPGAEWVASFPTDAPFFPEDLVARLMEAAAREGADLACATSDGQIHSVFAVWPVRLRGDLRRALVEEEVRTVARWTDRYKLARVDFPCRPFDPFFNINRPEDLGEAEALLARAAPATFRARGGESAR
jgi:molybdopterin-guanine dinucleotide biosynthesis protein A